MEKMWAGRFQKNTDETVNDFNASLPFDCRLYAQDIEGSLVHSQMLADQKIISIEDKDAIHAGLKEIRQEIEQGNIPFDTRYEDIHMCIEQILTEKIGEAGKRLHTGRSRNDQVALDMRLYCREQIDEIIDEIKTLLHTIKNSAQMHLETVMPGYTHLQRAQPVTFAHYMMAYASMLKRDIIRFKNTKELMNECPLGSAALASTTYPLDRHAAARALQFTAPCANSMDGVSDRDYCVELLSDISICMMHLSRLSEEIIAWCSWEFKFVELDDAFSTGSSIMPQKKNPDVCELIRGKTGRVYGDLMQMLTMLKGLPLAYNKDMQEDKESVFDAIDTLKLCLRVFAGMFESMRILEDNMKKAASEGFINATDCADYLTRKGLPFRTAYKITGSLVAWCIEQKKTLETLSLEEYRNFSEQFDDDIYEAVDLSSCLHRRNVYGGPAPQRVQEQIDALSEFLENL